MPASIIESQSRNRISAAARRSMVFEQGDIDGEPQ
jgi:hypothetical protein